LFAAGVFKGVFPMLGQAVPMASFINFDAGGDGEAGYGEADKLPLAAAKAADRVTHEENLGEILRTQTGAAEALAGAVLALDGDTVLRIDAKEWFAFVGRAASAAGAIAVITSGSHSTFIVFGKEWEVEEFLRNSA
jgi:hypothetical protein